jgi:integrase
MKTKITNRTFREIRRAEKPYRIYDSELKGFALRVQPSGTMTYYLEYRNAEGKNKTYRIGPASNVTVAQARRIAEDKAAEIVKGIDIQDQKKRTRQESKKKEVETLKGFLEKMYSGWAATHLKNPTIEAKRIENNFDFLLDFPMADIQPWAIEKWRSEQLGAGKAKATVNRDLANLRSVLSKAVDWEILQFHPLQKIKPLRLDQQKTIRFLSPEEEIRLLEALNQRERTIVEGRESGNRWRQERGHQLMPSLAGRAFADHLKPMILVSLNTGMRRGEVFNLKWQDVQLNETSGIITIQGSGAKSGQTRHIPMNDIVNRTLKSWNDQSSGDGFVFPGKEGRRFDNVTTSWSKLLTDANIQNFRWHDMRHHFASRLVMKGVDINTVRELLGHADTKMTLRYAHLAPEHKAEAVQRLVN